ncbi:MAG TPA: autotransporter-associated beta strand repeat-containing protein, partial [Prosthecobacter sp.]|nr:autotransporter-associated beta strand repeat-containing protein [Prosthecobacter sp.]
MNSATALYDVTVVNGLNLNGAMRTIQVDDNSTTFTDYATLAGVITGGAGSGLNKTGSGTLYITGANTYTGNTILTAGNLIVTSIGGGSTPSSNLGDGTGTLTLAGGYLLYAGPGENVQRGILVNGTTTIESSGSGALVLNNVYNSLPGNKTLTLRGFSNDANQVTSLLADNGGSLRILKDDGGTWELPNANTFTGGIAINSGYIGVGSAASLGPVTPSLTGGTSGSSTTVTLASGSTNGLVVGMYVNGTGLAYGDTITSIVNSNTVTISTARTIPAGTALHFGGVLMSNGGIYSMNGAPLTLSHPVSIASNNSAIFNGTGSITLNGPITGVTGNPWLIVNTIANPAALVINGNFTGGETTTARTLTFGGTGNTTMNGNIGSGGAIVTVAVNTSGTVTFGGTNSTLGGGTLTQGTVIANANPFGSTGGTLTLIGGLLQVNTPFTGANTVSVLSLNGNGTNSLNAAFPTIAGSNSVSVNTLQINAGGNQSATRSFFNNLSGGAALTVNTSVNLMQAGTGTGTLFMAGSGNTIFNGPISNGTGGAGAVIFNGTGSLTLTADSTYTGATSFNNGTVNLSGNGRLGTTSGVTVNMGAVLNLNNTGGNPAAADRLGNKPLVLNGATLNFTGSATGSTEGTAGNTLTVGSGASTINVVNNGATTQMNFTTFTTSTGGFTNFTSNTALGTASNRVMFSTAPTLTPATTGILPRALVNGADFATYGSNGITAYSAYNNSGAYTNINSAGATDTVKAGAGFVTDTTLGISKIINALNITSTSPVTVGFAG